MNRLNNAQNEPVEMIITRCLLFAIFKNIQVPCNILYNLLHQNRFVVTLTFTFIKIVYFH